MTAIREALRQDRLLSYAGDENVTSGAVRALRTDLQLVELVIAGDEAAFEQIFDRHKKTVAKAASRYFQRPDQIEEVIQISFAKAFVEMPRFRGEHELSLHSWLGRIASNTCLDMIRSIKRKPEDLQCELTENEAGTVMDLAVSSEQDGERSLVTRDLSNKLLSHLGEEDRALLHMFYVDEMTVAEIASLLGWSASKVKIRAWRARNNLRKVLKRYV